MKNYTEKELQKTADKYHFNDGVKEILAVEDGSFFDVNKASACRIHAGDLFVYVLKQSLKEKKEEKKEDTKTKNKK